MSNISKYLCPDEVHNVDNQEHNLHPKEGVFQMVLYFVLFIVSESYNCGDDERVDEKFMDDVLNVLLLLQRHVIHLILPGVSDNCHDDDHRVLNRTQDQHRNLQ